MSIYNLFNSLFSKYPYSVIVSRNKVSVLNTNNGNYFECEPLISIAERDGQEIVTAIGSDAKDTNDKIIKPFSHPRLLVNNFFIAEKIFAYCFRKVSTNKWLIPSPEVVIQVNEKLEGGMTDIETRVLRELSHGAGARKTYIVSDILLTNEELMDKSYKNY